MSREGRRKVTRGGISYSQHPQLLESHEVVLVDPSDVVAIEFPGGGELEKSDKGDRGENAHGILLIATLVSWAHTVCIRAPK